jgi:hypothetical protein
MSYARRGVLASIVFFIAFLAVPSFAATLHPKATSRGMIVGSKSVHAEAAGIFFSGSFGYSVGSGQAHLTAQNVTNPNGTASGPLRFSLWWMPNAPYPSAGGSNTAQYVFTSSLAAGGAVNNIDSGLIPFTDPGNGCYYVALVLEEDTGGGNWVQRDYANFSLRISSGQGCLISFTGSPLTISPGGSSTLSWTTGGSSVTIDNGLGTRPANGSVSVTPAATTTYTLTVNGTADGTPRTGQVTITVGAATPAPTATFSAAPTSINAGQSSTLTWTTSNATTVSIDNGVGSKPVSDGHGDGDPACANDLLLRDAEQHRARPDLDAGLEHDECHVRHHRQRCRQQTVVGVHHGHSSRDDDVHADGDWAGRHTDQSGHGDGFQPAEHQLHRLAGQRRRRLLFHIDLDGRELYERHDRQRHRRRGGERLDIRLAGRDDHLQPDRGGTGRHFLRAGYGHRGQRAEDYVHRHSVDDFGRRFLNALLDRDRRQFRDDRSRSGDGVRPRIDARLADADHRVQAHRNECRGYGQRHGNGDRGNAGAAETSRGEALGIEGVGSGGWGVGDKDRQRERELALPALHSTLIYECGVGERQWCISHTPHPTPRKRLRRRFANTLRRAMTVVLAAL